MHTRKERYHLEIQTSRKSPVGLIRTTFWDKVTKSVRHTQVARIKGYSLAQLKILQRAFSGKVKPSGDPDALHIADSRELGASRLILELAKKLGLHRIIFSRTEPWVNCVLAMIVGRVVYQGSKLSLCNRWQQSTLWELCGVEGRPDVDAHCYAPLDRLLERQEAIQKKLAEQHLGDGSMILYDITSTYFEGEYDRSELVKFGYNRDGKKGHEQVVVGLMTTAEGCPIGCEVFEGNTSDATTVMDKIEEVRKQFGLDRFVFVGDRGMVTQGRFEEIRALGGINSISALTHAQLKKLLERDVIQPELFDEKVTIEVTDPEDGKLRYCLCKNPVTQKTEQETRKRLIELTIAGLQDIANYKQATTVEILGARVGKLLAKYKVGKFVKWSVEAAKETGKKSRTHRLIWEIDHEKIAEEEKLDGCYIIRTDTAKNKLDTESVVAAYKSLGNVERAFRNLKTVQLEMRPVYHKTDKRIRAHVFLCTLAYYLQWHMQQRLKPLFESDGENSDRCWTFELVVDCLKQLGRHTVKMGEIQWQQDGEMNDQQQRIYELIFQKT